MKKNLLRATAKRVELLRAVRERQVEYDTASATYLLSGKIVGGWDYRTLAYLVTKRLVARQDRARGPLTLTRRGGAALHEIDREEVASQVA